MAVIDVPMETLQKMFGAGNISMMQVGQNNDSKSQEPKKEKDKSKKAEKSKKSKESKPVAKSSTKKEDEPKKIAAKMATVAEEMGKENPKKN